MRIRKMTHCGIFAAAMAICAWLAVPFGHGAVTMQTVAVFLSLCLLGGPRGFLSILIYLCLGAAGLPVFAGFQGGFGVLLGPTGGFLWGFLATAGLFCLPMNRFPLWFRLMLCQLIIYLCGTFWYYFAYGQGGLWVVLMTTVVPYLLPDALKITLSLILVKRLNYRLAV